MRQGREEEEDEKGVVGGDAGSGSVTCVQSSTWHGAVARGTARGKLPRFVVFFLL